MKKIVLACMATFLAVSVSAQSSYKADPAHSSVNFKVKHLGINFVSGKFEKFDGEVVGSLDNLEASRVTFNVDMNSVNTSVQKRDDHLRSADFFDVQKFPTMSFKSTGIEKVDDKTYKLNGTLQIKDVSKPVTFDVTYGGATKGRNGEEIIGFVAKNTINRFDYNVAYDPELSSVGKDVHITLYLEFKGEAKK